MDHSAMTTLRRSNFQPSAMTGCCSGSYSQLGAYLGRIHLPSQANNATIAALRTERHENSVVFQPTPMLWAQGSHQESFCVGSGWKKCRRSLEETTHSVGNRLVPGWKQKSHRVGTTIAPGWKKHRTGLEEKHD